MAATARVVDLTDVKEGGNFRPRRKPEGDYKAKIVKSDDHQPNDKSKPLGWVLTVQIDGDARSTYPIYLSPDSKQVWKVYQVARAAGFNLKKGRLRFDPNKLVNKAIGVSLVDDEYEGRVKSTIDETFPVSEVGANANDVEEVEVDVEDEEVDEEEEIEEEPAPRRRRKPAPEPEPEEDDLEPTPPPRKRTARARKAAPAPEPEDDEEEDEDPAPPPRRRRKAAPPPPVEDEDEDLDLDELDDDE